MTTEMHIAFVAAAAILIVAPGPSVMLIVSHAMGSGLKRSLFTIAGQATSHARLADRTRALYKNPKQVRIENRIPGGLLVGAGVALAAIKNK